MRPTSSNPYPISGQNLRFSLPNFRRDQRVSPNDDKVAFSINKYPMNPGVACTNQTQFQTKMIKPILNIICSPYQGELPPPPPPPHPHSGFAVTPDGVLADRVTGEVLHLGYNSRLIVWLRILQFAETPEYEWRVLLYASFFKRCRCNDTKGAGYSLYFRQFSLCVKNQHLICFVLISCALHSQISPAGCVITGLLKWASKSMIAPLCFGHKTTCLHGTQLRSQGVFLK